jgi:hypothetical protein
LFDKKVMFGAAAAILAPQKEGQENFSKADLKLRHH